MFCIFCTNKDTEVIETRVSDDGATVRRRRHCPRCVKRFTTYERIEDLPITIVKNDGRRERFNRDKVRNGMLKSCEKTTITAEQIENIVSIVEKELRQESSLEIPSNMIGKIIAKNLKKLDKIAYIRFASVFRRFEEVEDFEKEVKKLL